MFERFTDRARRVIVLAQEEARELRHPFIRPEHLLLGLLKGDGVAHDALAQAGVGYLSAREKVTDAIPSKPEAPEMLKIPFSPQAKKMLELSLREALRLGHNYIGTEHLLLGVLRGADADLKALIGVPAEVLQGQVKALLAGSAQALPLRSPATLESLDRARRLAGQSPTTTGHLLAALLADVNSQASRVLARLDVTGDAVSAALAETPVEGTSDEPPGVNVTIRDPEVVAAVKGLSESEIAAALRRALLSPRGEQPTGTD